MPGYYIDYDDTLILRVSPYIKHRAADVVKMDHETDEELYTTLINKDINSVELTPSDIFFANTIPLKDLEIDIDERNKSFKWGKGCLVKYRIVIPENFDISQKEVGYLIVYHKETDTPFFVASFGVNKGSDYISMVKGWSLFPFKYPVYSNIFTNTWYAIQIALLNPRIKTLFSNPTKVPIHNKGQSNSSQRRKVKYTKVYKLNVNDVKDITYSPEKINRKCLVWYVIGHWRKYKSGKEIFIQGYWKGQLREIKQNLDDRERIVDYGT